MPAMRDVSLQRPTRIVKLMTHLMLERSCRRKVKITQLTHTKGKYIRRSYASKNMQLPYRLPGTQQCYKEDDIPCMAHVRIKAQTHNTQGTLPPYPTCYLATWHSSLAPAMTWHLAATPHSTLAPPKRPTRRHNGHIGFSTSTR